MTGDVIWPGGGLGDIAGPENLAGLLGSFIGALPDLYAAEWDIIAENNLVVVRHRFLSLRWPGIVRADAGRPSGRGRHSGRDRCLSLRWPDAGGDGRH